MDKEHKSRLRANTEHIVGNFDVTRVVDKLLELGVIHSDFYEALINDSKYPTVTDKNRAFMSYLPKCGPEAYQHFLSALSDDYDYIIKKLEETEITEDIQQDTRWKCMKCNNVNSQRDNTCLNCNQPRKNPPGPLELTRNATLTQPPKKVLGVEGKRSSPPKYNERRIIIIGKTGMGKSAICNSLIGREVFESKRAFDHVTKECFFAKAERQCDKQIFDIHVYDTPGALGDGFKPDDLAQALGKAILIMTPGVHCFVIATKFDRANGENEMIRLYEKIFGETFYKHMIGIFTEKDLLQEDGFTSVQDILNVPSLFHESLRVKISNRYLWFNCKAKLGENDQQFREFIRMMDDMCENIQKEDKFYTNKYFEMAGKLKQGRIKELQRERRITWKEAQDIAEVEASSDSDYQPSWVKQFIGWFKTQLLAIFTLFSKGKISSQPRYNERRIIVIGKQGMGKSAICNSLIGRKVFKTASTFGPITKECSFAKAERHCDQQIFNIHVCDTPGALGDGVGPDSLAQALGKAILVMTPGVHCFVLVSKFTRTVGENEMMRFYTNIFGETFYEHMIGIFTEKDLLQEDGFTSVQDILRDPSPFHQALRDKISNRYLWFNCKAIGGENDQQLREFIIMMNDMNERIQKEDKFYTNKYFEMAGKLKEERIKQLQRERRITWKEAQDIAEVEASSDSEDQPSWVKQFTQSLYQDVKQE